MIDQLYKRQEFTSPIKLPLRVGIEPELGRCLSQWAGSGTIPTRYGIFIPAAEDTGPDSVTFESGLFRFTVY